MYDPDKYKKSNPREELGYIHKSDNVYDIRQKSKIISSLESPLKRWWLEQQEADAKASKEKDNAL